MQRGGSVEVGAKAVEAWYLLKAVLGMHVPDILTLLARTSISLTYVIAAAPQIPGVEHVSGNFLESVPSGDVMLIQACHKALPDNGKVIIRDYVIFSPKSSAAKVNAALHADLLMVGVFNGRGRERTSKDWERILKEAGFPRASLLSLEGFDVIEAVKT